MAVKAAKLSEVKLCRAKNCLYLSDLNIRCVLYRCVLCVVSLHSCFFLKTKRSTGSFFDVAVFV